MLEFLHLLRASPGGKDRNGRAVYEQAPRQTTAVKARLMSFGVTKTIAPGGKGRDGEGCA